MRAFQSFALVIAVIVTTAGQLTPVHVGAEELPASETAGLATHTEESLEASILAAPELLLFQEIPIVVTASRIEERVTEAPASVTVITRQQILSSGAISIPDLLRMVPGVDVMQSTGANWEVSIRGVIQPMSNKALVLVDGRTVYNDLYASVNWHGLPVVLEDIERIEIIRGPLSSLWGANASLGVINIITRSAAQSQGTSATAAWGTRGTVRANVIHGGELGDRGIRYKLSAAREEVGQWTAYRPDAREGFIGDRKAGAATKANLAVEWDRRDGSNWTLHAGESESGALIFIDYSATQRLWEEDVKYVSLDYSKDDLSVRAYWNGTRIDYSEYELPTATVYTDLYNLEALKSQTLDKHAVVYGASYRRKAVGQANFRLLDDAHRQHLWAAYVEDAYQASERTKLVLSARYDRHPLAGGRVSGRATAMYSPTPRQTLRLSAANAFRSPTFLESYLEISIPLPPPLPPTGVWGNTGLDYEGITAYDLEYRAELSPRTSADVCVFYNELQDFILYDVILDVPRQQQFANLGAARARGAEVEVRRALSPVLSGFANYTYLSVEGVGAIEDRHDSLVKHAPRHKANLGFTLSDPDRGLNGSLLLSYRDKVVVRDQSAGPYVLVNGYVGKKIGDNAEAGISFFNLANRKHQQFTRGDYIGRRIMGSVRWEF